MNRKKLERAVGETTHAATDLGKEALALAQAYLQQAQENLAPRAQGALHQAQDYLAPRAKDALHHAQDALTPLARDARKRGAYLAATAVDAARPRIDEALDRVSPAVEHAYQRVAPRIDDARSRVQEGLLPWLSDVLHEAAEGAARIELPEVPAHLVQPPKRSVWATLGQLILAGGLLAGVVFAVKKFLAPADSGWQAHEPSSPYVPTSTETLVEDLSAPADDAGDAANAWLDDTATATATATDDIAAGTTDVVDDTAAASEDVLDDAQHTESDTAEGDAAPFVDSPYGEGSYVGTNPPEGFVIKGNERSMKFHVQGNGGYERTIADVWFSSEAAAEAAGFTKAQR